MALELTDHGARDDVPGTAADYTPDEETDVSHLDMEVQADVHLEPEQWERLRLKILAAMQAKGQDAETAFWNNVYDHIQTLPNLVVVGNVVGPQDLAPDVE